MKSKRTHEYEVYALLWVTRACEDRITRFLLDKCNIPQNAIQHGLHLTVYYARRPLLGLVEGSRRVHINATWLKRVLWYWHLEVKIPAQIWNPPGTQWVFA